MAEIPSILAEEEYSHFWSFVLFLFTLCLGLSTIVIYMKTVSHGIRDALPAKWSGWSKYSYVFVGLGTGFFALPMTTAYGYNIYTTVGRNCCGTNIVFVAFLMVVAIGYVYGTKRFIQDVGCMKAYHNIFKVTRTSLVCWKIYLNGLLPAILLGIMVLNASVDSGNRSSTNIVFLEVLAQGLVVLPIIVVPVVYLVRDKEKGAVRDRLRRLLTPTKAWGPYNKTDRLKWASRKAFSTRHSILPAHAKDIKVTEKSENRLPN